MAAATASMVAVGGLLSLEQPALSRRVAKVSTPFLGNVAGLRAAHVASVRLPAARAFTVRSEKYQVIEPLNGDPFIGSLETPITSSPLIAWWLSNLPGYRTGVNPLLRGVEVGLAHGFFLVGPFVKSGPLRNTELAGLAGSLGAAGLVVILSLGLTIYGIAQFQEGQSSSAPSLTLTGRKKEADKLQTAQGWANFSGGFFFGGLSGVAWAYILLFVLQLPYPV
eukprot:TRINITY_DN24849_c0_g1_i1.p1 TRINITY_DN24849_c0_g1~~TRINITY_DN24849_c0_g1_i1.p1  ORF type:complete len:256 (-),score=23.55 TRINITY_DN24849_c0_g1_i1:156-824(-)